MVKGCLSSEATPSEPVEKINMVHELKKRGDEASGAIFGRAISLNPKYNYPTFNDLQNATLSQDILKAARTILETILETRFIVSSSTTRCLYIFQPLKKRK